MENGKMDFKNFNVLLVFLQKDIDNWQSYKREKVLEDYKSSILEKDHFLYSIEDGRKIISNSKILKQHAFWAVSEILSEIFALNPPLMYKYKPKLIEWSYKLKLDKSIEYMYGRRWNEWNQILNIVELLKERSDSKRAVIDIYTPYDTDPKRSSIPCTLMYTIKVRNKVLNFTTFFRSHDLFRGVKYDVILSSFMAQLFSVALNEGKSLEEKVVDRVKLYSYEDSLHVYNRKDSDKLEKFRREKINRENERSFDIMDYHSLKQLYDDLYTVLRGEEFAYCGNFEDSIKYLKRITTPVIRDFLRVYINRNYKHSNIDKKLEYETDSFIFDK